MVEFLILYKINRKNMIFEVGILVKNILAFLLYYKLFYQKLVSS